MRFLIPSLLALSLYAASKEERLQCLEERMDASFTATARGDFGAAAASAAPQLNDNYHLFVATEVLFWKQFEGGDDYAYTQLNTTSNPRGDNKHLTFDWSWGFRVESGLRFPHDQWDLIARYTWFRTHALQSVALPSSAGAVRPLYPALQVGQASFSSVTAKWKTSLQVLDVEWDKNYFLNPYFALQPTAGLKTAWIHQSVNETAPSLSTPGRIITQQGINNFWGIGPSTGLQMTWFFSRSWNLFSALGGSLMVSHFDVRSQRSPSSDDLFRINLKADMTRIVPMAQGAFGAQWEMNFRNNKNHIAIQLAYEAQYWWRQNQLLVFGQAFPAPFKRFAEDLGVYGASFNVLFDF